MSKLGYTWYPKDWTNSQAVFELTLIERGLYRELIDMAMLNDNKTKINYNVWSRRFASSEDELEQILLTLEELQLISIDGDNLFIPSCEPRLNLIRGGSKGGKKSKKNKPMVKPNDKPTIKPTLNQIEKEKEKKYNNIPTFDEFKKYAIEKSVRLKKQLDESQLSLKYDSWIENNWKDGNNTPIKNWKSKLLNTLPYLLTDKEVKEKLEPIKHWNNEG